MYRMQLCKFLLDVLINSSCFFHLFNVKHEVVLFLHKQKRSQKPLYYICASSTCCSVTGLLPADTCSVVVSTVLDKLDVVAAVVLTSEIDTAGVSLTAGVFNLGL